MNRGALRLLWPAALLVLAPLSRRAEGQTPPPAPTESGHDATELAKATQNPVSDLVSVPIQFNFFTGSDLADRTLSQINLQPVLPLPVTSTVNVIVRTIVPFVSIPLPGGARESGIGDTQLELFFTPAHAGAIVWGIGPIFSLPTATADSIRTGEWGVGPAAVVLATPGPFVVGALAAQTWHFAGHDADPKLSQLTLQPFINFNLSHGWSLSTSPIITANWNAPSGDEWTVPIGFGIAKVHAIGKQPVNVSIQYYRNIVRPTGVGADQIRFVVSFLFPKAPKPKS